MRRRWVQEAVAVAIVAALLLLGVWYGRLVDVLLRLTMGR